MRRTAGQQVGRGTNLFVRALFMLTSIRGLLAASVLAAGLAATPAFADETAAPSDLTVTGNVALVSDYRFRGLSASAGDVAVQGSIGVSHSSGLYVGTWASSISGGATYGHTEVDLYGGWTGAVGSGITADVGLLYYAYPNGHLGNAEYFEPYASLSAAFGPATAKVGAAYAWKQKALDTDGDGDKDDNLYVYGELGGSIPNTPVSLLAHLGYASGAQSPKLLTGESTKGGFDYNIGATYNITPKLSVGVQYVGVDGNSFDSFSDDTVVGTLKLTF